MNLQQVKNSLEHARSEVAKGWCQGMLGNEAGEVCSKGALHGGVGNFIPTISKEYRATYDAAMAYLLKDLVIELPDGYDPIVQWNDFPGRTQKEVLAFFDKAITLVETDLKPTYFKWLT